MRIVDSELVKLSECVFKIGSAVHHWEDTAEYHGDSSDEWKADFEYVKKDYLKAKRNLIEHIDRHPIFFEKGKKQGIYLRTLGNIVMLVPPLAISEKELELLLNRTVRTIKAARLKVI